MEQQNYDYSQPKHTRSHHVYGKKAAVEFRLDWTRKGLPTIAIDGAGLLPGSEKYNWASKISIQITGNELPFVAAVLHRLIPKCEFKYHGNKGYSLEYQAHKGHFFVRVYQGDGQGLHAVPMPPCDAFYVCGLVMKQLHAIFNMESTAIMLTLKTFARAQQEALTQEKS